MEKDRSVPTPLASLLPVLLQRPIADRVREYKYWFAQSVIFGLPVLGLRAFGPALGGAEGPRWSGFLQALLAGWVSYAGAAGMFVEGLLLLRRKLTADLLPATLALGLYAASVVSLLRLLATARPDWPLAFHWSVIITVGWTGFQWRRFAGKLSRRPLEGPSRKEN